MTAPRTSLLACLAAALVLLAASNRISVFIDTVSSELVYHDGTEERALTNEHTVCGTWENLAAANDDQMFYSSERGATLLSSYCHCEGTCTTEADLSWEIREVGSATVTDVTGSVTCEDTTAGDSATTLSGATTYTALDVIRFDVDNAVSPETDEYQICLTFKWSRT